MVNMNFDITSRGDREEVKSIIAAYERRNLPPPSFEMYFTNRTKKALISFGITNMEDLLSIDLRKFLRTDGVGKKTWFEVKLAIEEWQNKSIPDGDH
jgi:hypothetical protein